MYEKERTRRKDSAEVNDGGGGAEEERNAYTHTQPKEGREETGVPCSGPGGGRPAKRKRPPGSSGPTRVGPHPSFACVCVCVCVLHPFVSRLTVSCSKE